MILEARIHRLKRMENGYGKFCPESLAHLTRSHNSGDFISPGLLMC